MNSGLGGDGHLDVDLGAEEREGGMMDTWMLRVGLKKEESGMMDTWMLRVGLGREKYGILEARGMMIFSLDQSRDKCSQSNRKGPPGRSLAWYEH